MTWTANFRPDFSRNHVHVYWDTFTADQVSNDAAARGVEQGSWHPTDEYPEYTTESEASVHERNGSDAALRHRRATATTTSSTPRSSSAPTSQDLL